MIESVDVKPTKKIIAIPIPHRFVIPILKLMLFSAFFLLFAFFVLSKFYFNVTSDQAIATVVASEVNSVRSNQHSPTVVFEHQQQQITKNLEFSEYEPQQIEFGATLKIRYSSDKNGKILRVEHAQNSKLWLPLLPFGIGTLVLAGLVWRQLVKLTAYVRHYYHYRHLKRIGQRISAALVKVEHQHVGYDKQSDLDYYHLKVHVQTLQGVCYESHVYELTDSYFPHIKHLNVYVDPHNQDNYVIDLYEAYLNDLELIMRIKGIR